MADEPMPDAAASAAKPRRRFAPQLVEETVKSSRDKPRQPAPETKKSPVRETRDASVQVDDIEMAGTSAAAHPRRRFAPVPIETTFDSYRVNNKNPHGPTAELTPDPSPTESLPPVPALPSAPVIETKRTSDHKPKRRFAPQLIETSRRARRAGQEGPATKPTDKTDITPGTNHIYAPKAKRKSVTAPRSVSAGSAAEASEDSASRVIPPRRQQSMKPHPNTRRGTRSYHPDLDTILSSESDKSGDSEEDEEDEEEEEEQKQQQQPQQQQQSKQEAQPKEAEETKMPALSLGSPAREPSDGQTWASRNTDAKNRRESCDEEFSGYLLAVAAREAFRQRELEQAMSAFPNGLQAEGVEHFFVRDSSDDDVIYDEEEEEPLRHGTSQLIHRKETDPIWAIKEMRQHAEELESFRVGKGQMTIDEDDESVDPMETSTPPEDPLWTTTVQRPESRDQPPTVSSKSPFAAAKSSPRPAGSPHIAAAASPRAQPEAPGFKAFASPFSAFSNLPFGNQKEDRELRRMRKAASPPMLGTDLKFRTCPSPKATRMEPDHPWPTHEEHSHIEDNQRDVSGATGLWRGYCVAKTNEEMRPSAFQPPNLLATPSEPWSAADPFAAAFSASMGHGSESPLSSPTKRDPPKGLHLLHGLDERLKKEKVRRERLLAEFDDAFVTQVYNYLSLGYPATARAYDDELSKISHISISDLRRDDNKKIGKGFMLEMELKVKGDSSGSESSSDEFRTPEEDEKLPPKPPRWSALKLYIREWARQHPDLGDDENSLAWGVRARRGSWAI